MKTWMLKVNENELRALIQYHSTNHSDNAATPDETLDTEISARIHDLTKRLNKETPEIETDQQPKDVKEAQAASASAW